MLRRLRRENDSEAGELTIVPYLDILMNLILFMVVSMTGLGMLRVVIATREQPGAGAPVSTPVSVSIDADGFAIDDGSNHVEVPNERGVPDFARLRAELEQIGRRGTLLLRAAPGIDYQLLISTMDAARTTADGRPLFADVTLAQEP